MDNERRLAILKSIKQQLEDTLEAKTFECRLCVKVQDVRGEEAAKKVMTDLDAKLKAAEEIEKELTKKEPEKPKE